MDSLFGVFWWEGVNWSCTGKRRATQPEQRIAEEGEDILNVDKAKGKFLSIDVERESEVISLTTDSSLISVNTFDDINKKVCELHKSQLENTLLHFFAGDDDLEDENGQKLKTLIYGETIYEM